MQFNTQLPGRIAHNLWMLENLNFFFQLLSEKKTKTSASEDQYILLTA